MITKNDFLAMLKKDSRTPISADISYPDRNGCVNYVYHDFDKIKFPVRIAVLVYEKDSGKKKYIGDGKYKSVDRRRIKGR